MRLFKSPRCQSEFIATYNWRQWDTREWIERQKILNCQRRSRHASPHMNEFGNRVFQWTDAQEIE